MGWAGPIEHAIGFGLVIDLPVADPWFVRERVDDAITLVTEPHVHLLLRCNVWQVRGRDRDLVVDTALGLAPLRQLVERELDGPLVAVATHSHGDHVGGLHEFDERAIHRAESEHIARAGGGTTLDATRFSDSVTGPYRAAGSRATPSTTGPCSTSSTGPTSTTTSPPCAACATCPSPWCTAATSPASAATASSRSATPTWPSALDAPGRGRGRSPGRRRRQVGEHPPDERRELEAVAAARRTDDDRAVSLEHEVVGGRRRVEAGRGVD